MSIQQGDREFIELLKKRVWEKAVGSSRILNSMRYFKQIREAVDEIIDLAPGELHEDSIRNFFRNNYKKGPQLKTLDKLSQYVLEDRTGRKTFDDFKQEEGIKVPTHENHEYNSGEFVLNDKDQKSEVTEYSIKRKALLGLCFVLLTSLCVFLVFDHKPDFREDFQGNSIEELQARGWQIIDLDTALWRQSTKNGLTLLTGHGDYWYSPPAKPVISNLVVKKISCSCCTITVKLTDFAPYQPYQQAGFFLLNKNLDRNNNLRITRTWELIQAIKTINHDKLEVAHKIPPNHPTNLLWLRMEINDSNCSLYWRAEEESASFKKLGEMDFAFSPKHIGLAAFSGIRYNGDNENIAKNIPARFEYIQVSKCK